MPRPRKPVSPFRYFNSSPEIIRLGVSISLVEKDLRRAIAYLREQL